MAFSVQNILDQDAILKKYRCQVNFSQAFSKSKGVIELLFDDTGRKVRLMISGLQYIFQRTMEPVRPGRKYLGNHKAKPRKFFPQYAPIG